MPAPRPSVVIATRLPSPIASATANPTASGRQLVSRSSPTWIDIPTAARAMTMKTPGHRIERDRLVRVDHPIVRSVARARNPSTNSGNGTPDPAARGPGATLAASRPDRGDEQEQRRHERVADQLDDRRHDERIRAVGGARGDDLAGVVDSNAGPQPELRLGQRDGPADRRVQEDRERPEQGDRGDRIGDLAGPGADDRRGGDDRGVAAHGRADRDQQPEPALDPDEAGRDQDDDERQRHRDQDQPGGRQSDPGDLAQAEPCPEQDDAEAQDPLRGEREARPERPESWSGDRRHDDPEQEGDRDVRDDRGQEQRDQARHGRDRDRGGKTGGDRPRGRAQPSCRGSGRCEVRREPRPAPVPARRGNGVPGLEGELGHARDAAHAMELEGVVGVRLVGEGSGLCMRRATGCGTGLRPAIPQAERQAPAVRRGRSLEVVDEARGVHRLGMGPVVVGPQAVLVGARSSGGSEGDHVPLARLDLVGAGGPGEGVSHGKTRIPVRDR